MSNKLKNKHVKNRTTIGDYLSVVPCTVNNISIYTLDTWKRIQGGDEESYYNMECPGELLTFLYGICREQDIISTDKNGNEVIHKGIPDTLEIRPVVIDEEYYEYLNKAKLEDTQQHRLQYITSFSDENAKRLLKKNRLNWALTVFTIPICVIMESPFSEETFFSLDKEKEQMTNILETVYGKGNVYVPGYICHANYLKDCEDDLLQQAYTYFHDGVETTIGKYKRQLNNRTANIAFYFVPFIVKHELNTPRVSLAQLMNDVSIEDEYKLNSDSIFFQGYDDINSVEYDPDYHHCKFSFERSGLDSLIKSAFTSPYHAEIVPMWDFTEDCESLIEYATTCIIQTAKTAENAQVLLNNHLIIKK